MPPLMSNRLFSVFKRSEERKMYKFKKMETAEALRRYLARYPRSSVAKKALDGDPASMLSIYKKMCENMDDDEGPSLEALDILAESASQEYTPAMIEMARVDIRYLEDGSGWPNALNILYEAMQLGDDNAKSLLVNEWYDNFKELESAEYQRRNKLNKYQEFAIGFYYIRGIGVRRNLRKGKSYLLSSASHLCHAAEKLLNEMNPTGSVKEIEEAKREEYYRLAIDAEYDDDVINALEYYAKALKAGEIKAFRPILCLVSEKTEPLQGEILSRLEERGRTGEVKDDDLVFIRKMLNVVPCEISNADAERLFRIADEYNVVWDCIECAKNEMSYAINWQEN